MNYLLFNFKSSSGYQLSLEMDKLVYRVRLVTKSNNLVSEFSSYKYAYNCYKFFVNELLNKPDIRVLGTMDYFNSFFHE